MQAPPDAAAGMPGENGIDNAPNAFLPDDRDIPAAKYVIEVDGDNGPTRFLPPLYSATYKNHAMTQMLVLYVLLPSGVLTEHADAGDMDASVMPGGWHVELKLNWPAFFYDHQKHFVSTFNELTADTKYDAEKKIPANQNDIIDSFNKRAALQQTIAAMRQNVTTDMHSVATIELGMKVHNRIVKSDYFLCKQTKTRVAVFDFMAFEESTYLETAPKKFKSF